MPENSTAGVYGTPPPDLVELAGPCVQFSPLTPGSAALEDALPESFDAMTVLAPPGTIERRSVLALALRALRPGAVLTVLAAKDKGGLRIAKELAEFGCTVGGTARRHYRISEASRPERLEGIEAAVAAGALQQLPELGLWTQPGVFSWDRTDAGSALLLEQLPALAGRGADLGCGIGVLALSVLASPRVDELTLVDIDRRAVEAARRNVADPRARVVWADARTAELGLSGLDFVVMNPPFHEAGIEDRELGQAFIRRAASLLRPGGTLWLTANRHLPYEAVLKGLFKHVVERAQAGGYKIFEARK